MIVNKLLDITVGPQTMSSWAVVVCIMVYIV